MDSCIFCRIAAGQIPATRILEDEAALAFMDIGPVAEGHLLLIPKAHFAALDEVPAALAGRILCHLPSLVRAVRAATGCEGVNVLQNNGRAAHQEVMHVHFHIIPRWSGDAWKWNWPAQRYADGRLDTLAKAIRERLA